jgi:hypothetical protein
LLKLTNLVFHANEKLVVAFPDSALLIVAGFSVGTILGDSFSLLNEK